MSEPDRQRESQAAAATEKAGADPVEVLAPAPAEDGQAPVGGEMLRIASDVPDLGAAYSVAEFCDWCGRHREGLRQLRVRLGEPPPASVARDEFRAIPEIVRQCRLYLRGLGASDVSEPKAFSTLPYTQTSGDLEDFGSGIGRFLIWASCYRAPGHGLLELIGSVEEFLPSAMSWCRAQERPTPAGRGAGTPQPPLALPEPKKPILKDAAEILVRNYLAKHREEKPTIREVNEATGVSLGAISDSAPWQVYQAEKKAGQSLSSRVPNTRRLTRKILEAIGKKDDPSDNICLADAAWQYLLKVATEEEKAQLRALNARERAERISLVIDQFADPNVDES
jgi:hypothetical protein